jgi:leader peptidase (prepilin peptidase) / N-methyltransferase
VSSVLVGVSAAAGAVGGAFVPSIAYRLSVAAGEPSREACATCGRPLPPGVAGWLRLPSRCAGCAIRLGPRPWLTAGAAGLSAGLLAAALGATPALPLFVAMAVFGVLLAVIDLACKRLPHVLVFPAIWVTAVLLAAVAAATGDWDRWLRAALASLILGLLFFALYLVPGQGLGFGDVKLAFLLGLFLGWVGWRAVLLGALLPWLINAPVALGLLLARRVGRKSALPFGPALLAGGLAAIVVSASLPTLVR